MREHPVFVDTNVLVHMRDPRDQARQAVAEWMAHLWESRSGRLSTQVLHEYYVCVTAKLDPGLEVEDAREDQVPGGRVIRSMAHSAAWRMTPRGEDQAPASLRKGSWSSFPVRPMALRASAWTW